MTNKSSDEEKLDFEKIRSKFLFKNQEPLSRGSDEISNVSPKRNLAGRDRWSPANNTTVTPPVLLPKPNLKHINQKLFKEQILENGVENEAPNQPEDKAQLDVKEAIRRFNAIGPKLFEQLTGGNRPEPSSTSNGTEKLAEPNENTNNNNNIETPSDSSTNTDASDENIDEEDEDENTEKQELATLRRTPDVDEPSSGMSSLCKGGTLHRTILDEMRNNGLFKSIGTNHLPADIGKMRENTAKRSANSRVSEPLRPFEHRSLPHKSRSKDTESLAPKLDPTASNNGTVLLRAPLQARDTSNTLSVDSSQSASTFSDYPERDSCFTLYNSGDEKEDRRLRELHAIAREFYQVQKTYVELLNHIGENYPKFLQEYSARSGKTMLYPTSSGLPHVILRISGHFKQILGVHRMLLDDFAAKYAKWDSRDPDLASILQQKAEFLKICNSFLKEKRTLSAEMQQALDENKELAFATKQFEENVLNSPGPCDDRTGSAMCLRGISLVMQLDSVHQNIVRYRLLVERYRKHLPDHLVEATIAEEALRKLTVVSNAVNGFLAGADVDQKLMPLHRKLGGVFDVFAPGRQLIHEGELQRQTRKELQLRYLILFSDTLLIFRYGSLGTDNFDLSRMYKIPIERVCVQFEEHEDYETEFVVKSPKKSSVFVAKSKRERDIWVMRITETRRDYREKKRKRRSFALQKNATVNSHHNSCEDSPEVENRVFPSGTPTFSPPQQQVRASTSADHIKASRGSQRYEALWIPDNKASKCLMVGCDTKFNMLRRKHHCRQCGWLICRHCVGYAPVKFKGFEREKVCPECYYAIKKSFEEGKLFSLSRIQRVCVNSAVVSSTFVGHHIDIGEVASPTANAPAKSPSIEPLGSPTSTEVKDADSFSQQQQQQSQQEQPLFSINDTSLRIVYDGGLKYETPKDLFQPPANGPLRKVNIPAQKQSEIFLVSGKVYMKNRKGIDVLRWARLQRDLLLQFYEAEFDDQPLESHLIYGYLLSTTELDDGGCVIELTHRNQFQTDRKEDRVIFQVAHSRSAERWLTSLRECIGAYSEEGF